MSRNIAHSTLNGPKEALPVDMDYMPEYLKIRAKKELFEDDKTRVQSLKLLKTMLNEEKGLLWQDDDRFLVAFLRARKYDVQKAFNLLKGFYTLMGKHGYHDLSVAKLRRAMGENSVTFLPYRDRNGCIIVGARFAVWDPQRITPQEHIESSVLGSIEALQSPATQVTGYQIIFDFKGLNLNQLLAMTPSNLLYFSEIIQSTVPFRLRGIHVVNQNYIFSSVSNLVTRLLSKKLRERVHIHGKNLKSLHKHFHPSILPADWGGELPPYNNADWQARMEASDDFINNVLSYGYQKYLQKRPGKEMHEEDYLQFAQ